MTSKRKGPSSGSILIFSFHLQQRFSSLFVLRPKCRISPHSYYLSRPYYSSWLITLRIYDEGYHSWKFSLCISLHATDISFLLGSILLLSAFFPDTLKIRWRKTSIDLTIQPQLITMCSSALKFEENKPCLLGILATVLQSSLGFSASN